MTLLQNEQRNPKQARRREHIADLATLPVFFSLKGKKVVLAGDSDGAAWKAELLAAAGAIVHVYCVDPGEEMIRLLTGSSDTRRVFVWHMEPWTETCFEGAILAIGDIEAKDEAERFVAAANSAGAVVNLIDNPDYCQFQFGSIVNRSPVVVSISTDGAAPILGQAIRRRIESLLPPAMAHWAQLAQALRPHVMKRFKAGAERRRFWEAFVDRAFSNSDCNTGATIEDIVAPSGDICNGKPGKVTIMDVWHGQSDLLPMRAIRALHAADIIVYGEGTSTEILELARREAHRLSVNDAASSLGDKDVNASGLVKKLALSGKHVVRLVSSTDISAVDLEAEHGALVARSISTDFIPTITKPEVDSPICEVKPTNGKRLQFG